MVYDGAGMGAEKNTLADLEIAAAAEIRRRRRKRHLYPAASKTRLGKDVKAGKRKPPPVPKNKSVKEVSEMPAESKEFRHPAGRPRKYDSVEGEPILDDGELDWHDKVLRHRQRRTNERRARARKGEAKVVAAVREMETHVQTRDMKEDIYDEDKAIAEGILDFDDWDNEELIRGYRRGRRGNFGVPPKMIPREVQQAAFRILVSRGDRKLKEAYIKSIDSLITLAHTADSEKVRLEAIKELMNRVVGKVPDTLLVAHEAPWEGILADSVVPLSATPPLEMEVDDDGVARLPYVPVGDNERPGDSPARVKRPQLGAGGQAPGSAAPVETPSVPRRRVARARKQSETEKQAAKASKEPVKKPRAGEIPPKDRKPAARERKKR